MRGQRRVVGSPANVHIMNWTVNVVAVGEMDKQSVCSICFLWLKLSEKLDRSLLSCNRRKNCWLRVKFFFLIFFFCYIPTQQVSWKAIVIISLLTAFAAIIATNLWNIASAGVFAYSCTWVSSYLVQCHCRIASSHVVSCSKC